jgi:hypothetical protein
MRRVAKAITKEVGSNGYRADLKQGAPPAACHAPAISLVLATLLTLPSPCAAALAKWSLLHAAQKRAAQAK